MGWVLVHRKRPGGKPSGGYVCPGTTVNCAGTTTGCLAETQAAHDAAADGAILCLPPGTFTWQGILNLSKAITLRGAGLMPTIGAATFGGTTIIPDWAAHGANALIGMTESTTAGKNLTLCNITIDSLAGLGTGNFGHLVVNDNTPSGQMVIWHHLTLLAHSQSFAAFGTWVASRGLAYRNKVLNDAPATNSGTQGSFIRCSRENSNLASWQAPGIYGTQDTNGDQLVYVETNTVQYLSQMIDVEQGCRMAFRNNTVTNGVLSGHGQDSSDVSGRILEAYDNTFICQPGVLDHIIGWVTERGGTVIATRNSFDKIDPTTCANGVGGGEGYPVSMSIYKLVQHQVGGWAPPYPTTYPVNQQIGWGWRNSNTTTTGWGGALCPKGSSTSGYPPCEAIVNSITFSGTTATVTTQGHSWITNDVIHISGATGGDATLYNGDFAITFISSTQFSYTMSGTPAANATGALQARINGLTRSGTTARAFTITTHHMNSGDTVLMQNASDANYNGSFTATVIDTQRFTYTVGGSPATPAVENPTINFWQTARGGQAQSLEPWYVWNNSGTSTVPNTVLVTNGPDDLGLGLLSTDYIQINREYYQRAPQGGDPVLTSYTSYQYPHPLATVVSE